MNNNIFELTAKKDVHNIVSIIKSIEPDIDESCFIQTALDAVRYYRGKNSVRDELRPFQRLETSWYESLSKGYADYSVYKELEMVLDVWACWQVYSKGYLKALSNPTSFLDLSIVDYVSPITSVLDLGCGIGYTSAGLKNLFPDAQIFGTQLDGTYQRNVCDMLSKRYNFSVITSVQDFPLPSCDLVFASEYFEHIENPIEHLNEILEKLHPKFFIIANSFNTKSVGHFNFYTNGDYKVPSNKISKTFNDHLRNNGYKKHKTKLWNNRPAFWER